VTGHGWRKLMRLSEPFVYRITEVREPHPVFRFVQQHGPVDEREAYATFNMGVGFAVYVAPADVAQALELARANGYQAWTAGEVRKEGNRKAVQIDPLNVTFEGDTLKVR
jgi:phosphoribosylformylglycinamidine cyclo-ligase